MDRAIKFRGKARELNKWVYGSFFNGLQWADFIIEDAGFENRVAVLSDTVGQFTRLLDKNGKEIYEGDIVKSNLTIGIPNTGCSHKIGDLFVVVCLPSGYTLMAMRDYRYEGRRETPSLAWNLNNYFFWNYHNHFEVIGSIHDNPELVKGGKE